MAHVFIRYVTPDAALALALRAELARRDPELAVALSPPASVAAVGNEDVCVALVTLAALADPAMRQEVDTAATEGTLLVVRVGDTPLPPRLLPFLVRAVTSAEVPAAVASRLADWLERPALRGVETKVEHSATVAPPITPTPQPTRRRPTAVASPPPTETRTRVVRPRIRRSRLWARQGGIVTILLLLITPFGLPAAEYNPPTQLDAWWVAALACLISPAMGFVSVYLAWSLIDPTTSSRPARSTIMAAVLATAFAGASAALIAAVLAFVAPDLAPAMFAFAVVLAILVLPMALISAWVAKLLDRPNVSTPASAPVGAAVALALIMLIFVSRPLVQAAADNRLISDVRDRLGQVGYRVDMMPDWSKRALTSAQRDGGVVTITLGKDWNSLTARIREFQTANRLAPTGQVTQALLEQLKLTPDKLLWRLTSDGKGGSPSLANVMARMSPNARVVLAAGTYVCPEPDHMPERAMIRGAGARETIIDCRQMKPGEMEATLGFGGGSRIEAVSLRGSDANASGISLVSGTTRETVLEDVRLDGMSLGSYTEVATLRRITAPAVLVTGGSLSIIDSELKGYAGTTAIVDVTDATVTVERTRFPIVGDASAFRLRQSTDSKRLGESRFIDNDVRGATNQKLPAVFIRAGSAVVTGNRFENIAGPCILVAREAAGRYEDNRLTRCGRGGSPAIAIARGSGATVGVNQLPPNGGLARGATWR